MEGRKERKEGKKKKIFKYICVVCTGFKTVCLRQDQ